MTSALHGGTAFGSSLLTAERDADTVAAVEAQATGSLNVLRRFVREDASVFGGTALRHRREVEVTPKRPKDAYDRRMFIGGIRVRHAGGGESSYWRTAPQPGPVDYDFEVRGDGSLIVVADVRRVGATRIAKFLADEWVSLRDEDAAPDCSEFFESGEIGEFSVDLPALGVSDTYVRADREDGIVWDRIERSGHLYVTRRSTFTGMSSDVAVYRPGSWE